MAITRTGGNFSAKVFIKVLYSQKLQTKFYAGSVLPRISNTDWEGEIKGGGDTVNIRKLPDIVVRDYVVNEDIEWQDIADDQIQLTIDYAKYAAYKQDSVDFHQMDVDLKSKLVDEINNRMRIQVETVVLSAAYTSAAAGPAITESAWSATTAVPDILAADRYLGMNNLPLDSRWLVINPHMKQYLLQSNYLLALNSGLDKGAVQTGLVGQIGNLKIYESTLLAGSNTAGSPYRAMAGHMAAISFASQFTDFQTDIVLPNTFAKGARALNCFGWKVTQAAALEAINAYGLV